MKSIIVSNDMHAWLMNQKNSKKRSVEAVIEGFRHPNDDDIISVMNRYIKTPFVCFECGNDFRDVWINGSKPLAVLMFDPGSSNYPVAPDEPASFYFECIECYNKKIDKESD